ncbi:MAG: hypothetical protein WDN23_08010 [Edaphobacter sp.]
MARDLRWFELLNVLPIESGSLFDLGLGDSHAYGFSLKNGTVMVVQAMPATGCQTIRPQR